MYFDNYLTNTYVDGQRPECLPSSETSAVNAPRQSLFPDSAQGCQMVYLHTKTPIVGKFLRTSELKMLVFLMAVWDILQPFGIVYSRLVYFTAVWYSLQPFGIISPFWYVAPRKV
jgi:hypothetical protein